MAINIKFDSAGNPEPPTIVLAKRNGDKLGQLDAKEVELNDKFNDASEMSFTLYKYTDGKITNLWDDVVDFKLIYCKEWDLWFEITVELDEETETIKTVMCTQLGQAELSQLMLYDIHINEEGDSNWNIENKIYKNTILYNPEDTSASLLHRLLKDKAPHYSILHVDDTIKNIQRAFSFDGTSIYDAFMEIAEEIGCLFIFHSNSDKNGKIQRTISVYDLQQNCLNPDCKHRGEFIDICPKCGGKDIDCNDGIFKDTTIFITNDELASGGIQLTTDTDSVKNCFKLEAGDDLMTATVRNCNPNGTDYIWYFSEDMKSDMSEELVEALEGYDEEYKKYYNTHVSNVDMSAYNALVERYAEKYNANSVRCLSCGYKGNFENVCPECGSNNLLVGDRLESIEDSITGYSALMNAYYNVIDLGLYLESGLMPSVDISDDLKADDYADMLTNETLSPVAVDVNKIDNVSLSTVDSAVESMAKIIFKSSYKVEAEDSSLDDKDNEKIWTGRIKITSYSDEDDTATTGILTITIVKDDEILAQQRIDKAMSKLDAKDLSISGLIAEEIKLDENGEHVINEDGSCECDFCKELKNYALNPLQSFYDACEECLTILQDQGAGNEEINPDLYKNLYNPYRKKLQAIADEIAIREGEVNSIKGVWDKTNEDNKVLVTKGLQQHIEDCKNEIQNTLNFQKYLENKNEKVNLWLEFCTYRREDKHSNDNYISDGLNNAELFKRASEFVEVAENEIFKSAELQHSISTSLNNLLAIPKFKPLVEYFSVGNWIRVRIDERVYKLRLLEYNISFDSFDTISVDFSDVTKIKTGVTDIQEVLSQASSMATSYSSVQKQASQGEQSKGTIDQWLSDGLNSAQVRIQSNDTEDVVLDRNGLLCRSYNEITDTYDPEQFRLTHNIMAFTDDNWNTVSTALGKHDYVYFDDNRIKQNGVGYGLSAKFVTAGVVTGSQIIGGDIYSNNYSKTESTGSYLNLTDGTFSFGGGALRFENGKLLLSSPDIPTTETITEINEEYLKTTSVYAENLQINSAHIKGKLIIGQLPDTVAETEDIPTKVSQLNNDSGYQTATGVTTIVNGVVTTDYVNALGIKAGSVDAENISGTTISGKTLSGMSGEIGGWTINTYNLYSTDGTNTVSLNSDDGSVRLSNADGNVIHQGWASTYGSSTGSSTLDITAAGINLNFVDETQAINFNDSSSNTILSLTESGISDKNQLDRFYFTAAGRTDIVAKTDLYLKCDGVQSDDVGRSLVFRYYDNAATTGSTIKEPFFMPCKTGVTNLGGISYRWKDIYSANAVNVSSDRNLKKDIQFLDEKYIQLFDLLEPVSFKFVDGTSGRTHIGFIAQDVEDAMEQVGLTNLDFAGFCKNTITDNDGNKTEIYSLRYGEFTALNTAKIKQLEQQIIELKNEIKELKS